MTPLSAALFVLALLFAGAAGTVFLLRAFREVEASARLDAALALGLPVGLVAAGLPCWFLSGLFPVSLSLALPLAGLSLAALFVVGRKDVPRDRDVFRRAAWPLAIPLAIFIFFLFLRWTNYEIRQTEKPMDFAILTALTTTPSLPLQDPWLAGERFSYYHFGTYLLSLPLRASGFPPGYGYNIYVALLAALAGAAVFAAVRLRGGGRGLATLAAAFLLLSGTPDGARQVLGGKHLSEVDFWVSERRVANAITEWPLWTFFLGDLHPHAVAFPFLLTLVAVAGRVSGALGIGLDAVLLGSLLSANPWDLPATLLILGAGNLAERPLKPAVLRSLATVALSTPVLVTFLRSPRPPSQGLFFWPVATTSLEGFLHFGALAAVLALSVGVCLVRAARSDEEALLYATAFPAVAIGISIVTGRPVLGLALGLAGVLLFLLFRRAEASAPPEGALRAGLLFAAAGGVLAATPDVVVVLDSYGEQLRRMNTVFKTWSGAYPLLVLGAALTLPAALSARRARKTIRLVLAVALLLTLFHPAALIKNRLAASNGTLDGLAWLTPGERKTVAWLRQHAGPSDVLAEAPGVAYSDHSRIGGAAGRPIVLGWANHESVWRGETINTEVAARQADLRTVYLSRNVEEVEEVLARRHVRWVVVGPLEQRDFGGQAFPTSPAFERAFEAGDTALYDVRPPSQLPHAGAP